MVPNALLKGIMIILAELFFEGREAEGKGLPFMAFQSVKSPSKT